MPPSHGPACPAGYFVVAPDFFDNETIADFPQRDEFFAKHPIDKSYGPVDEVLQEIRSVHGSIPVAVEGFCWGGHFTVRLAGKLAALSGDKGPTQKAEIRFLSK